MFSRDRQTIRTHGITFIPYYPLVMFMKHEVNRTIIVQCAGILKHGPKDKCSGYGQVRPYYCHRSRIY